MIKTTNRLMRFVPVTLGALCALTWASGAIAQSGKVNSAIAEQVRTEKAAQQSQSRVTELDDQTSRMLSEYRQVVAEAQSLKTYNNQMAETIASQEEEMASMTEQLGQIEDTARGVLPLMTKMVDTLDQFVALDAPYLQEERAERLAGLQEMMTAADVTVSEKYRRIVEAYQIELEYGRTLESYQGKVGDKTVDFLRLGRVALLYQTLDGSEVGYWDASQKAWVVDNGFRDSVRAAMKVAKKQAAPELLVVPVAAPQEVN